MRIFRSLMQSKKKPENAADQSKRLIQEMLEKKKAEAPAEAARLIKSLVKRKEVFGEEFVAAKDYEIIFQNEDRELRLYYPTRRTITINNKRRDEETGRNKYTKSSHFVQLPHLIFAYVKNPYRRLRPELDANGHEIDPRGLYLVFVKGGEIRPDTPIFMPTLPNSHHDYKICQGSAGGFNFDNRVQNYWTSEFLPSEIPNGVYACQTSFYHLKPRLSRSDDPTKIAMQNWSELKTVEEVEDRLSYESRRFCDTVFGKGLLWDGEKLYEKPPFSQADQDRVMEAIGVLKSPIEKMRFVNNLMNESEDEDELDWLERLYYDLDYKYWAEVNDKDNWGDRWFYYNNR